MAGPSADLVALAATLKYRYDVMPPGEIAYEESALFGIVEKDTETDIGGAGAVIVVRSTLPNGGSSNYQQALNAISPSQYNRFIVQQTTDYGLHRITNQAVRATKGKENAVIDAAAKEVDNVLKADAVAMAISLYGNGGGSRGQISTVTTGGIGIATSTIQLTTPGAYVYFSRGMTIQCALDDGAPTYPTAPLGPLPGQAVITGINHNSNQLTIAGTWTGTFGSTLTTGAYIFRAGDYGNRAAGLGWLGAANGTQGWVPLNAPVAGESWQQLDRSPDTRLYGLNIPYQGTIEETLIYTKAALSVEAANPDLVIMNPFDFANFEKAISSKTIYDRGTVASFDNPEIGYSSIKMKGVRGGMIDIVQDLYCPRGIAGMLERKTFKMISTGPAPGPLDDMGPWITKDPTADAWIVSTGAYWNFVCNEPGLNAVMVLGN